MDDLAQPDHGGHGVGQGPRRPEHRQHLVLIAPGHRRLPAVHLVGHEPDRRIQPVPGRQPVGHRLAGEPPTAVPLYSTAYGLYYNKAEFAAAGISGPPATWTEFVADAKKLTKGGHYGLTLEAGQIPENVHLAFELSQQQGGSFFDSAGKPTFDTPQNVAAIKQMIDFMQADKIANPSDAQYSKGTEALTDYATGKSAMVFWQTASGRWPSWA